MFGRSIPTKCMSFDAHHSLIFRRELRLSGLHYLRDGDKSCIIIDWSNFEKGGSCMIPDKNLSEKVLQTFTLLMDSHNSNCVCVHVDFACGRRDTPFKSRLVLLRRHWKSDETPGAHRIVRRAMRNLQTRSQKS